jgi:hypothetical protein
MKSDRLIPDNFSHNGEGRPIRRNPGRFTREQILKQEFWMNGNFWYCTYVAGVRYDTQRPFTRKKKDGCWGFWRKGWNAKRVDKIRAQVKREGNLNVASYCDCCEMPEHLNDLEAACPYWE